MLLPNIIQLWHAQLLHTATIFQEVEFNSPIWPVQQIHGGNNHGKNDMLGMTIVHHSMYNL